METEIVFIDVPLILFMAYRMEIRKDLSESINEVINSCTNKMLLSDLEKMAAESDN